MMTDISAWQSYNQAARSGQVQRDHNTRIMQLWDFEISATTKTAQVGINTSLSLTRKRLDHKNSSTLVITEPLIST